MRESCVTLPIASIDVLYNEPTSRLVVKGSWIYTVVHGKEVVFGIAQWNLLWAVHSIDQLTLFTAKKLCYSLLRNFWLPVRGVNTLTVHFGLAFNLNDQLTDPWWRSDRSDPTLRRSPWSVRRTAWRRVPLRRPCRRTPARRSYCAVPPARWTVPPGSRTGGSPVACPGSL